MNCKDCAYCWKEEDDMYPVCHWETRCPGDIPPCEEEPYWENEEEDYW